MSKELHLCDSCKYEFAECKTDKIKLADGVDNVIKGVEGKGVGRGGNRKIFFLDDNIEFGDGVGNDNVVSCDEYADMRYNKLERESDNGKKF